MALVVAPKKEKELADRLLAILSKIVITGAPSIPEAGLVNVQLMELPRDNVISEENVSNIQCMYINFNKIIIRLTSGPLVTKITLFMN